MCKNCKHSKPVGNEGIFWKEEEKKGTWNRHSESTFLGLKNVLFIFKKCHRRLSRLLLLYNGAFWISRFLSVRRSLTESIDHEKLISSPKVEEASHRVVIESSYIQYIHNTSIIFIGYMHKRKIERKKEEIKDTTNFSEFSSRRFYKCFYNQNRTSATKTALGGRWFV